ncbi:MAG TPA: hypothetical protein VF265_06630 [Nevskiaceae bacterium]
MPANVLTSIVRLLVFRGGPQDVPYAPRLVRWMVPAAALVGWLLFAQMLPPLAAAVVAVVNVLATILVAQGVLRARNLVARTPQTIAALLGTGILLNLLMVYPLSLLAPYVAKLAEHPEAFAHGDVKLPGGPVLVVDFLNVWGFAVTAWIYRHAANVRLIGGIGFALLASIVVLMLMMLVAAFISAA